MRRHFLAPLLAVMLACCASGGVRAAGVSGAASAAAFDGSPGSNELSRYRPVVGTRGMVASDDPIANEWGAEILRRGGNAIDAAVATAFMLSVTKPHYASLGGGGFLVYCPKARPSGESVDCETIDYRETAPAAASRDMYVRNGKGDTNLSQNGALAVGVPGVVAGLFVAHSRWGALPLRTLLTRPIEIAKKGFRITGWLEHAISYRWENMNPEAKRLFGCVLSAGQPLKPCPAGTLLKQPELAQLLMQISSQGSRAFYKGPFAAKFAQGVKAGGGIISAEDLAGYVPGGQRPVVGKYKGFEVLSMPPPSAGGTMLLQMLGYFERAEKQGALAAGYGAASSWHVVAHALALSFADRAELFGDPEFVKVPIENLLSTKYLDERWKTFDKDHAAIPEKPGLKLPQEGTETTHFSVIDGEGAAVAITTTLNELLGSAFVAPGTGVVLNNEMDDFSIQPGVPNTYGLVGAEANAIAPGKRPLSSMTPTIVRDAKGQVRLVIGAQGGPRITSSVTQIILNRFGFGLSLPDSVTAARIHEQWKPPTLKYEIPGLSEDTVSKLRSLGYTIEPERASFARVHAIERFSSGRVWGFADPRGEGSAVAE